MNFGHYLFGVRDNRFVQYPLDGNADILHKCSLSTTKRTMLTIMKHGTIVHYIYTKNIKNNGVTQVMGVSIIFNGIYIKNIRAVSDMFERIFSHIVIEGNLLKINRDGSVIFKVADFAEIQSYIDKERAYIETTVESDLCNFAVHFKQNFSGQIGTKTISLNSDNREILLLSDKFNVIHLISEDDKNVGYVSNLVSQLNKENIKLRNDYKLLERQKKQYRYVVIAAFIILCCGLGLFFLYDDLDSTQGQLMEAKITIIDKNNDIKRLNASRDSFKLCLIDEKQEKRELEKNLSAICTSVPFVITSCSINAEEVVVDYYAAEQKNVTVYLKAINESEPEIVSNSHSVTIYKGKNKLKLSFNYRLNPANYYYVNILYDGHVIGGRRW